MLAKKDTTSKTYEYINESLQSMIPMVSNSGIYFT